MSAKLLNSYASTGTYLAYFIKNFMVSTVGWGLAQTIEDTAVTKDYVLSSEYSTTTSSGTTVTGTFCVRLSGTPDTLGLYGYDDCAVTVSGTTYSGEIHDFSYSEIKCPENEFQYWAIADSDCLKIVLESEDSAGYYHGYIGLIDSVYAGENDPIPLAVFGTSTNTSGWVDDSSVVMRAVSGTVYSYSTWLTYSAEYGDSARTAKLGGIRPILYLKSPSSQQEVRGFPKGVFKIPDSAGGAGRPYTVDSGTYYSFSLVGIQQTSYMYGPVY